MQWLMIECPYCRVQQPAQLAFELAGSVNLTADDLPDTAPVTVTADLKAAKTHAATCKRRRTR